MIYIYKITSPSGKVYIGQTRNLKERIRRYKTLKCSGQCKLYFSLLKYGFDNHKFEILKVFNFIGCKEEIDNYEYGLINKYKDLGFEMLNLRYSNREYSSESISLLKNISKNKRITQYSKEGSFISHWNSITEACFALDIMRENISACVNKRTKTAGGYIWTEYNILPIINVDLSRKKPINVKKRAPIKYAKSIFQYSLDGIFIKEWDNSKTASKSLNISYSSLRACLSGKTRTCNGFIWKR